MNIQSLSIVVPTNNKCVNHCQFCVSRTHTNPYVDKINKVVHKYIEGSELIKSSIEYKDYFNRLQFARDNGCNVVVLTGTGEPVQNKDFLDFFSEMNSKLQTPFKSIEIQTTGVMLTDEYLGHLREIGVTTISFSISNIFDNEKNLKVIGCNEQLKFDVFEIIKLVKKHDFNLRLSLNLINDYDNYTVYEVLKRCEELGADQITFRKLYKSELNNEIDKWIENNASKTFYDELISYMNFYEQNHPNKYLGSLPFGPKMYDVNDISVVIDNDCMALDNKDTFKYLVLRENGKLYTNWISKASLVF